MSQSNPLTPLRLIFLALFATLITITLSPKARAANPDASDGGDHQLFLPLVRTSGTQEAEPFTYTIDPTVELSQPSLPGLDGGEERPLTALTSPEGITATYVANELVLQTDDPNALSAFLSRTGGELLYTIDPDDANLTDVATIYLIRADLSRADLSDLTADVTTLLDDTIGSVGNYRFGSEDGARLLAMAAAEASDGLTVGVNWVSDTTNIPVESLEAPNGVNLGGIPYTADAYDWAHFAQGTVQDIGVPEAWTLMSRAGRLSNRVDLAILDGGFFPNADFPTNTTYISVVPFITDPRNVNGVDGSAPFHGTDVLQTAAGRADDGNGIVGVAAPVVRPIAVYTTYDYVVSIGAVVAARAAGAEIINMSYSANVPAIFSWTVLPFEATTAAVRASGTLLFASAGNDGRNVDAERCFIVCWEHTWHTPCENAGVICVGGLGWNSQSKAGGSNYGAEHVDIFAPYTVYRGQSPSFPTGNSSVGVINGTSFSSPYAASVAALIWASNPSLSAGQVWAILRDTAHSSPDSRVNRYVNAYDAVLTTIGTGVDAAITAPTAAGYRLGYPVRLEAEVGYVALSGGLPLRVEWRVDGSLVDSATYNPGAGSHFFRPESSISGLGVGSHTVTLRATAGSVLVEDSVTFTIENADPTASIDQPSSGDAFCSGESINFRGSGFDENEFSGLPDSAFTWRSSLDGSLGSNPSRTVSTLSVGSHTITLRVTDSEGAWDEDSIAITILSPSHPSCVDLPPSAVITSPEDDYIVYADEYDGSNWYKEVTFTATIDDVEDSAGSLSFEWLSDRQGALGTGSFNANTNVVTLTANMLVYDGCGAWQEITLRVTDSAGNITEDQIDIFIALLC